MEQKFKLNRVIWTPVPFACFLAMKSGDLLSDEFFSTETTDPSVLQ